MIGSSFENNAEFIKNIEQDFNSTRFNTDYLILSNNIWKTIIKESNLDHGCSFSEYLTSIDRDHTPEGFYEFIEAYSSLLPELDLSVDEIVDNFLILEKITKSEMEYNVDLGMVLNGIRNVSKNEYDKGLQILEKSLNLQATNDTLTSAVITGLYENKNDEFYTSVLKKMISDGENLNTIFFGLSKVSNLSEKDSELFLDIIKEYGDDKNLTIAVLSLVFSVLKSIHAVHHQFCFEKLKSAVEDEITAYYILRNLDLKDAYSVEQTGIVLKLIQQDYFTIDKYIPAIAQSVRRFKNIEYFRQIILSIINVSPFNLFIKKFHTFIYNVDKIEIDRLMIELLTDNTASKRFTGIEIFQELSQPTPYRFTLDILTLPPISQYKLWMALTGDFHQPKDRLNALLPLLDSKSELVRESFLCKLEAISEDYGGYVLEVLEENLDVNKPTHNSAIKRIKKYIRDFYDKHTNSKNALSEFDPYNTHFKHIKKFNDLFHKNMSRSINQGAREDSFLSVLGGSTVQLSKGGGYRFGTKKEIAQLSSFGTSFTMPRSYFIDPNRYDMEIGMMIRQDWNDEEFANIIKTIDNE
ncbi:hypothetical protein [Epilithonimonas sp.]|uniref:hypothetical protein n=1 Tax=Epilithonimonas sp. TaxID=2894511 RepID=UPI00289C5E9F|nr:hypothetical protein [Epilithonimonas sp.]